jgi:alkylation response protein AidB-like acyl-CoA dehydrogenase
MASRIALPSDKLPKGLDNQGNLTGPRRIIMHPGQPAVGPPGQPGRPWSTVTGGLFTLEISMARIFAPGITLSCAHAAARIRAGMGRSKVSPIERYVRDARIADIDEGPSEDQRLVIARGQVGLR